MRKYIHKVSSHPLISGSFIILIGSVASSFIYFLFNLFMTRNLTVADYGAMASLLSLTTMFGLVAGSFVPTLIKFTGPFFVTNDLGAIKGIYKKIFSLLLVLGLLVVTFFIILAEQIGSFFNIQEVHLIPLVGVMIGFSYLMLINTVFIQAKLSFVFLSVFNLFSAITRMVSGVVLVLLGFALSGAIWANVISTIIPYLASFIPLGFLFKYYKQEKEFSVSEMFVYGVPASLTMIAFTSLITTDIILVKHLFDPHSAGLYSGISLVGRVIFFFTAPIGTVMFPLVIQKRTKNERYHSIFELALALVFLASLCLTIFYFLFPTFTIEFFIKNKDYLQASGLIGLFAVFITMYSLLSITINYFLSIGKTKIFIPVVASALLQVVLIMAFHDSFEQVLYASLFSSSLLLISLLLYYLRSRQHEL